MVVETYSQKLAASIKLTRIQKKITFDNFTSGEEKPQSLILPLFCCRRIRLDVPRSPFNGIGLLHPLGTALRPHIQAGKCQSDDVEVWSSRTRCWVLSMHYDFLPHNLQT